MPTCWEFAAEMSWLRAAVVGDSGGILHEALAGHFLALLRERGVRQLVAAPRPLG